MTTITHKRGWSIVVAVLIALAALPGAPVGARPASQATGTLPFTPRPLVNFGGDSSLADPLVPWLTVSGDWVAYATGHGGCGHCAYVQTDLTLRNVLDGRTIQIHGSSRAGAEGTLSIRGPLFAGSWLVWTQPGPTAPPGNTGPYEVTPGTYACAVCAYNVQTGQGGPASAILALAGAAAGDTRPLALDRQGSGRALVYVPSSAQAGAYWLVNLNTGATTQIPSSAPPTSEAVFEGKVMAWTQTQPGAAPALLVYTEGTTATKQVASDVAVVRTNGKDVFWYDSRQHAVEQFDLRAGEVHVLPATSDDYDVAGDRITWASRATSDGPITLTVRQLSNNAVLLSAPISGAKPGLGRAMVSLRSDKLVFNASGFAPQGGPANAQTIQLAWLWARDPAFERVWAQADGPVAARQTGRSWLWGPKPLYYGLEPYAEGNASAAGPEGRRQVQYYDKARMEINAPAEPPNPSAVTNGLLVTELISGEIAVGDTARIRASVPCTIPVAGDPRPQNPLTPSYAALAGVASLHGDHQAANRTGAPVTESMDANGTVGIVNVAGSPVSYARFAPQTGHNIPDVFLPALASIGALAGQDGVAVMGYPITEAYWTQMRVDGQDYPVLIQAYQRRVLTYAPTFAPAWQVQQGNVGQHYWEWRYLLNAK